MEKGKKTAEPSDALLKVPGDWARSCVTEDTLSEYRQKGWLPPAAQLAARAPGLEVRPDPRAGERVCFAEFLPRGFALPLHDFVRGLLYAYGIQLHDLTPNSIMHITCFMVLCECFLGVSPCWSLWKHIFTVRHNCRGKRPFPVGGFAVQVRNDSHYFSLKAVDSAQGWRTKWFYVPVDQVVLPEFSTEKPPQKTVAWDHPISAAEAQEASPLLNHLTKLLKIVPGIQLIATFMKMRVYPIRLRAHPMWQYEGPLDTSRMSAVELSEKELGALVKKITSIKASEKLNLKFSHVPYGPNNALPEVRTSLPLISILLSCAFCDCFDYVCMNMDRVTRLMLLSLLYLKLGLLPRLRRLIFPKHP
jgi:hypothetical protein